MAHYNIPMSQKCTVMLSVGKAHSTTKLTDLEVMEHFLDTQGANLLLRSTGIPGGTRALCPCGGH